jgi:ABC-type glycerol-3-phosphate transport system permease component
MTTEAVTTTRTVVPTRTSRRRTGHIIRQLVLYALAIGASILFILPFLWTIGTSLKPIDELYTFPPTFVPENPRWVNYKEVFTLAPFGRFLINSAIVTLLAVVGQTLSAAAVAFGFSRFRFPGRNFLFGLVLATMMLPWHVTIVPTFLLFRELGWLNTLLPLIVPSFFGGGAFYIFLLRQFFLTIPRDLDEAAYMDGASSWRVFWSVLMPLSKTALATAAIFSFIEHWNEFIGPLIFLNSERWYTVSIGLRYFIAEPFTGDEPREALLMAASLIVALPPLLIFFLAQKYFVQGIATTGSKG